MRTHIFRALSEGSFRNLWIGEIFTVLAGNIFNFFLILVVYQQTHSNAAVSAIVLSFTIPAILFGTLAGVYVDRWDKKKVLMWCNILRAFMLILLAFFTRDILILFVVSFVFTLLTQFFIPAETPMVPLVVEERHLLSANALFAMAIFGSILLAYILSGPLLILLNPMEVLLLLATMLIIGAGFISMIKIKHTQLHVGKNAEKPNVIREVKHTLSLMSRTKQIPHALFLLALSQTLILVLATVAPGYATQVVGVKVEEFPLLFVTPAAFGMVIGVSVLVNFFHSHPKDRVINAGIFLSGMAMLLLPFGSKVTSRGFTHTLNVFLPSFLGITILHIMVFLVFILGAANAFVFVPANTILQEKSSDESRGKIYGILNTVVGVFSLLPIIIAGSLSDLFGVVNVIIGIGVSLVLLAIVRIFVPL